MFRKIKNIIDITFGKFILVGIINTIFGTSIMFLFYNVFNFSYWVASASNYFFGSILSYFLNKYFTFKNTTSNIKTIIKFIVNISICYFIAYGAARPLIRLIFSGTNSHIQDNLAMFGGMCIFVILNYCGQRFWTFKN